MAQRLHHNHYDRMKQKTNPQTATHLLRLYKNYNNTLLTQRFNKTYVMRVLYYLRYNEFLPD